MVLRGVYSGCIRGLRSRVGTCVAVVCCRRGLRSCVGEGRGGGVKDVIKWRGSWVGAFIVIKGVDSEVWSCGGVIVGVK